MKKNLNVGHCCLKARYQPCCSDLLIDMGVLNWDVIIQVCHMKLLYYISQSVTCYKPLIADLS